MRLDRPIGTWLLYWPCAWSVALAGVRGEWLLFAWFLLGAFAMRSAGCVYNDIVDRDLDRQVERTRLRPLASGRVSVRNAWALAIGLSLIGLFVLLQLPRVAQGVALISIFPVAAYPFMKRITWWPQAWLGLVFSWGALVGWPAVTGEFRNACAAAVARQHLLGDRLRHALRHPGHRGRRAGRGEVERPGAGRQGAARRRHLLRLGAGRLGVRRSGGSGRIGSRCSRCCRPRCIWRRRLPGPIPATVPVRWHCSGPTASPACCCSSVPRGRLVVARLTA